MSSHVKATNETSGSGTLTQKYVLSFSNSFSVKQAYLL